MKLLITFSTDDGENFNDDHFGMASYFHVYKFFDGKEEFVEARKNVQYKEDETLKHGKDNRRKK